MTDRDCRFFEFLFFLILMDGTCSIFLVLVVVANDHTGKIRTPRWLMGRLISQIQRGSQMIRQVGHRGMKEPTVQYQNGSSFHRYRLHVCLVNQSVGYGQDARSQWTMGYHRLELLMTLGDHLKTSIEFIHVTPQWNPDGPDLSLVGVRGQDATILMPRCRVRLDRSSFGFHRTHACGWLESNVLDGVGIQSNGFLVLAGRGVVVVVVGFFFATFMFHDTLYTFQ
mmetsp:Transcript_25528/g.59919  ORF Transcript_25528/g.59919 Transcript_25528/m.59919 type:complete len:225 (-) Transcript_25528:94-768(-)